MDSVRGIPGQRHPEEGTVGVQADEQVVAGQRRSVSGQGLFSVGRGKGVPRLALAVGEGAVLLGDEGETGPAE